MNLKEGFINRFTSIRRGKGAINTSTSKEDDSVAVDSLPSHEVYKIINSIRSLSTDYKELCNEYDMMSDDSIIGSALELYADDATQLNSRTNRRVNISSDDKTLQQDLLSFLDSINIEDNLWSWAYDLGKTGDKFLRVVKDKKGKFLRFEDVDEPEYILDLFNNGVRVNFAEEVRDDERRLARDPSKGYRLQDEYDFKDATSYVHMMTRNTTKCDKLRVEVDSSTAPHIVEYQVVRGRSLLENARGIYRIIRMLEDSLLSARIAKAEYYRVYNVEVGENTPPLKVRKTINDVKNLFDSKPRINVKSGGYVSEKMLRPIGDPIFNPVKGGKGSITHDTVGGDFEVKSLVDIEYFTNKLFAALKIPKSYLGFEDSLPYRGDDTLMLQDMRYGRTVKRITVALQLGIVDMCNIWLLANGRSSDIGKFKASILAPSSAEELQRLQELEKKIEAVSKVMDIISGFSEYVSLPTLADKLIEILVDYPELSDAITECLKDASIREEKARKLEEKANAEGSEVPGI